MTTEVIIAPDDRLSANQVRHKPFPTAKHGYDPAEVRAFLGRVADELVERTRSENTAREAEHRATKALKQWQGEHVTGEHSVFAPDMGDVLLRTQARLDAEQVLGDARAQAEGIVADARAQADRILAGTASASERLRASAHAVAQALNGGIELDESGDLVATTTALIDQVRALQAQLRENATELERIAEEARAVAAPDEEGVR